jgi:hypothetical protein
VYVHGYSKGERTGPLYHTKIQIYIPGREMAVTKDAAESPVVRGGPAEPMGKCDKGWNGAGR